MSDRSKLITGSIIAGFIIIGLLWWWFWFQLPNVLAPAAQEGSALINRARQANDSFTDIIDRAKEFLPSSTPAVIVTSTPPSTPATTTATTTFETVTP